MSRGSAILKASLSALHYSGIDSLIGPLTRGTGAIFALHHVLPDAAKAFAPNRHLEVTPEFLDRTIRLVLDRDYDLISLDDARMRLSEGDLGRPFVCFTFDGGYRDTFRNAYPTFMRHRLPFAVYVASDYADGRGQLWWRALESLIGEVSELELRIDGTLRRISCERPAAKSRAFDVVERWLRRLPEHEIRATVDDLCRRYGVEVDGICGELAMGWSEIREIAGDPLVTVGAHPRSYLPLGELSYSEARAEIETGRARVEREINRPCRHFSFPTGGQVKSGPRESDLAREAGLLTGVTGHKGLLKSHHGATLAALPRIPLSGEFQKPRYVKVMLSGTPFALRRVWGPPAPRRSSASANA